MPKTKVVVKSTGHPAAHRKVRCPRCKLGYAIGDAHTGLVCDRCGHRFKLATLR